MHCHKSSADGGVRMQWGHGGALRRVGQWLGFIASMAAIFQDGGIGRRYKCRLLEQNTVSKALLDQQESAQERCPVCCQRSTYWASVGDEDQTLQRAAAATKANDNDDGDDNIDERQQRGIGRLYWKQSNRVCLFILLLYSVDGCLPAVASVQKNVQVRDFFYSLLC